MQDLQDDLLSFPVSFGDFPIRNYRMSSSVGIRISAPTKLPPQSTVRPSKITSTQIHAFDDFSWGIGCRGDVGTSPKPGVVSAPNAPALVLGRTSSRSAAARCSRLQTTTHSRLPDRNSESHRHISYGIVGKSSSETTFGEIHCISKKGNNILDSI